MSIAELVLDMILLNERQTKTGSAEVDVLLAERNIRPLEKRMPQKLLNLK